MSPETVSKTQAALVDQYGIEQLDRITKGVQQVANYWRESDGKASDFEKFCLTYYIASPQKLQETFERFESNLESIYGHNHEIGRELSKPIQLDTGEILPVDYLFAEYDPFAHINEDLFAKKIAFTALLNYPIYSLQEKLSLGKGWNRLQWAYTRLAEGFSTRIPADINMMLTSAYVKADDYISNYNIFMHQILDDDGDRLFPEGLRLITHWGLRDELKSHYANPDGYKRQKMIQTVMKRIIRQEIPQAVINNDKLDWAPVKNIVYREGKSIEFTPEPDTRYAHLLNIKTAEQKADPYYPGLASKVERRFDRDREIPQQEFEELVISLLTAPVGRKVARLIENRLGRKLEPFDIWYNGFKPRGQYDEVQLDKIVSEKYPTVGSFDNDLVNILAKLGFDSQTADFLAQKIDVDPSRGAGHAMGAERREDNAHLRTRVPKGGMKYKGFNIAIHELGHNVEQVFSLNRIDHVTLQGVPNTAFTEAFAFVFQSRDMDILGLAQDDPLQEHLQALDIYWSTCEIAAVGLVDLKVWQWMYDNPNATAAELKQAVISISKEIWNLYYAPVLGIKDSIILGIYSHMIDSGLYLPDYSLGYIIMFQIEKYLLGKNLASEMERMCVVGAVTPEAWMQQAVGSAISAQPLLDAVQIAVEKVK
ncbi:hypothetical protein JW935_03345 [candidate division KSB1 bacterium]|nr:hypothetical protein [candidate division KSB1 bacterium]